MFNKKPEDLTVGENIVIWFGATAAVIAMSYGGAWALVKWAEKAEEKSMKKLDKK